MQVRATRRMVHITSNNMDLRGHHHRNQLILKPQTKTILPMLAIRNNNQMEHVLVDHAHQIPHILLAVNVLTVHVHRTCRSHHRVGLRKM